MVDVRLHGRLGVGQGRFLIDTGSPVTIVDPSLVDSLGYGARQSQLKYSRLHGAGDDTSLGYVLTVQAFEAFGIECSSIDVHVHDMPTEESIDGLLGMDWLLEHVFTFDGPAGVMELVR